MSASSAASAKVLPQPDGHAPGGGAVRVSVRVPVSVDAAWEALTERDAVGCWFGSLSESLKPGGTHRLDFGDGDFFTITDVTFDPPGALSYRWRFLGTSPIDTISWSIEPEGSDNRLTVTDVEPHRTAAGCSEMIEGWTDFLQRLQAYCATGKTTRYPWRSEFGGAIELSVEPAMAIGRLLSVEGQRHWMPWSADAISVGAVVTMCDGQQPAALRIESVDKPGDFSLRFTLGCPEWRTVTECRVEVQPWPKGSLLVLSHTGWPNIDVRDSEQAAQRKRFGTLWTAALRAAQAFLTRPIRPHR